jgi:hypothetical protein
MKSKNALMGNVCAKQEDRRPPPFFQARLDANCFSLLLLPAASGMR